jgi:hypothetical protein
MVGCACTVLGGLISTFSEGVEGVTVECKTVEKWVLIEL